MDKRINQTDRNSSIELLRIIAMLGVFFLHLYHPEGGGGSDFCKSSSNEFTLRLFESLFICSVNLFVLISGYFLSQVNARNIMKPIQLLLQVSIFRIVVFLILLATGHIEFTLSRLIINIVPLNWFVILYVVLYCISPYINIIIDTLNQSQLKRCVMLLFILFSVYPTIVDVLAQWSGNPLNGLSTIGMYGSQYGYSIVQFVLMYIIGGFLSKTQWGISKYKLICSFILNTLLITAWSYMDKIGGHTVRTNAWEYCNPLVVIGAIYLFLIFKQVQFSSRIINNLSKACFTMYLLHSLSYRWLNVKGIVNHNPMIMMVEIFAVAVVVFIACYVIDFMYRHFEKIIFKRFNQLSSSYNVT